jgi:hypothetical protein
MSHANHLGPLSEIGQILLVSYRMLIAAASILSSFVQNTHVYLDELQV